MTVHVIQLEKLPGQIDKLVEILRKYEKQWKESDEELYTHDLESEIEELNSFRENFESLIEDSLGTEQEGKIDIYGNEFKAGYKYAEVNFTQPTVFDRIRLLGTDGIITKRFFISDVFHNFSPTTINLITNVRDIIEKPFNMGEFLSLCGKEWKESGPSETIKKMKQEIKYTWSEVAEKFFVPPAQTVVAGEMSDEKREKIINNYKKPFLSKEELIARNRSIQAEKRALYEKSLKDADKQKTVVDQLRKEIQEQKKEEEFKIILNSIGKFTDKFSFACLLQEALECVLPKNLNCETLFKDLSVTQIFDRLAMVFPRGSDTFKELERLVEENLFSNVSENKFKTKQLKSLIEAQEERLKCLRCDNASQEAIDTLEETINDNKEKLFNMEQELEKEQKRLFEDLQLSERQQQLALRGGNLFAIVSTAITDEEKAGLATNSDRVLKLIDTIIPLEDLCGLLLQSLTNGFDLSAFKLPSLRPINDIFGGFSAEIQAAFLQAIVQAILILIETMLNELFNCDNLDNLVAAAVAGVNENFSSLANLDIQSASANIAAKIGENSEKFGAYSDLVDLFGGKAPNLANSFDKNYEQFVDRIAPAFEKAGIVTVSDSLSFTTGLDQEAAKSLLKGDFKQTEEQLLKESIKDKLNNFTNSISSNRKGVLDYFFTQGGTQSVSGWDIDSTGEKFVVSDGVRLFDINNIDQSINASVTEFLNQIPPDLLTEDILVKLSEEEEEDPPIDFEEGNAEQALTVENGEQALTVGNQEIKNEMTKVVSSFISIASPTEVIKLMAGNATKEALSLLREIMMVKSPLLAKIFNNEPAIKNLFLQFGKATGLNELLPKMELLASAPESNLKLVPPKLCAPFNNVDNFRKAMMARTVPLETAEKILDSINNEKIKKYNELIDTLIGITTGNLPEAIRSDPKSKFLDEIKNNILAPSLANSKQPFSGLDPSDLGPSGLGSSGLDSSDLGPSGLGSSGLGPSDSIGSDSDPTDSNGAKKQNSSDMIRKKMSDKANESPVYNSMVDTALSSIFSPIRDSFDSDMEGYIESNSTKKQVEKKIPREIRIETKHGIQKVINPEFKELLNAGLVPIVQLEEDGEELDHTKMVDRSILETGDEGKLDDLRVSGNPNTDFIKPGWSFKRLTADFLSLGFENPDRIKKPILKTVNKKIVGDSFKIDTELAFSNNLDLIVEKNKFQISIKEFKSTNSLLPELLVNGEIADTFKTVPLLKQQIEQNIPNWTITFLETKESQKERARFDIDTKGMSVAPINGFEEFYIANNNTFKRFMTKQEIRNIITDKYSSPDYPLKTRVEVFEEFFIEQIRRGLKVPQQAESSFKNTLLQKQEKMIRATTQSIVKGLANTRLYQETDIGGQESEEKLVFLQLFNFVREPTKSEKECDFDPHIMGFSELAKQFKEIYDNEPEVINTEKEVNGMTKKKTRLGNASYKILNKTVLRLLVVDFCFKALPVLDSFLYTRDFSEIEFLNQGMLEHVINELNKMEIYDSFKEEFKKEIAKKQKQNMQQSANESELIDCRDVQESRLASTSSSNMAQEECKECEEKNILLRETGQQQALTANPTSSPENRNVGEDEFRQELGNEIREQFSATLDKFAKIFQISNKERSQDQFKKFFLDGLNLYDIHEEGNLVFNSVKREIPKKTQIKISNDSLKTKLLEIEKEDISDLEKVMKISKELKDNNITTEQFRGSSWETVEEEEIRTVQEDVKEDELFLERYVSVGKINNNFKNQYSQLMDIEERSVSLNTLSDILSTLPRNISLFDCDNPQNSIFLSSPRVGLRLNYVYGKFESSSSSPQQKINKFYIGNTGYDVKTSFLKRSELSVREYSTSDNFLKVYSILKIAEYEQDIKTTLTVQQMQNLANTRSYEEIFFPVLKDKILETNEMKAMFSYCIPTREIGTISLFHTYCTNNSEKQKYLFQPTKETIKRTYKVLDNYGNKTNTLEDLAKMREKQKRDRDNEGNPAGPLNFDALKIFLRTPIHILRGLATIVDPNVFIADKIVAGVAAAGALVGQKIYIPYNLTSLALLPFPLFTPPPIGIIPPFTAYNIALPLGPIFLILEPLLWDLPWFKTINGDPTNPNRDLSKYGVGEKPDCEDEEEGQIGQEQEIEPETIEDFIEQLKKIC